MEDIIYRTFGRQVRSYRARAGLTLEQLGEKAGISGAFVAHIEAGRKNASLATVRKIARALEISVSELLAETADLTSDADRPYLQQFARIIAKKTPKQKAALIWLVKDALDLSGK